MIVAMKKVYLILLDSEREKSLQKLKDLGVVHLEDCAGTSETLEALKDKRGPVEQGCYRFIRHIHQKAGNPRR
ncbi:hypothetical protein [Marispirochaeta aestuarii]|uniref:hypothetical protein n=1 Tax=Marispirochaeta aestuarii TaxID=1963862 RepID=UPI0029C7E83D|nr:hypothetical protein [Marispirochaeta aestuarii]